MSLISHLFKKDLRRSRLLLAVWFLLIVLQCALMALSLHPGNPVTGGAYRAYAQIGPLLKSIVLAVLIALVVQEEPPAGTTGFWLTRPLPRGTVLGTKVLLGALLIALPLLAESGVLAAGGVTRHDLALAAPEIVITELVWIVLIGVVASLTANFGQFAIAGVIVFVAASLLQMATQWARPLLAGDSYPMDLSHETLWHSRTIVGDALVILGLGAAFTHQYLTRRGSRTLAIALAFELLSIAAQNFWPWDLFPAVPMQQAAMKIDASSIKLMLRETQVQDQFRLQNSGEPKKNVTGSLTLVGVPEGYVALPMRVHPQLKFPDGQDLPVEEPVRSNYWYMPGFGALEAALSGDTVVNADRSGTVPTGLVLLEPDNFRKFTGQFFTYSATIDFALAKYVIVSEMPLVKGSHYERGSAHEFITDVLREGDGVDVVLQQRDVNLLFKRPEGESPGYRFLAYAGNPGGKVYLLRNRRSHEAVLTKQNEGAVPISQPVFNTRLMENSYLLSFGPERYRASIDLNQAWLADAELVELELKPQAEFSEALEVKNFTLEGPNRAKTPAPEGPPPNPTIFAPLSLSPDATKAQVKEYVDHVLALSQRWTSFQKTDPPVAMLCKVGPENLDVLLDALDRTNAFPAQPYLDESILELARPQDKPLIVSSLAANLQLIDVVMKFSWQNDCRDVLIAVLRDDQQTSLPRNWLLALASLKDPATYPYLKAYLLRAGNRQLTYNAIKKLPGIDLRETVDAAWKLAKRGSHETMIDASAMAIDIGYADALAALVNVLKENDLSQPRQIERAATLVKRYTPAVGDRTAIVAWYDANKTQLAFDPARRKFLPQPLPPRT